MRISRCEKNATIDKVAIYLCLSRSLVERWRFLQVLISACQSSELGRLFSVYQKSGNPRRYVVEMNEKEKKRGREREKCKGLEERLIGVLWIWLELRRIERVNLVWRLRRKTGVSRNWPDALELGTAPCHFCFLAAFSSHSLPRALVEF